MTQFECSISFGTFRAWSFTAGIPEEKMKGLTWKVSQPGGLLSEETAADDRWVLEVQLLELSELDLSRPAFLKRNLLSTAWLCFMALPRSGQVRQVHSQVVTPFSLLPQEAVML